MPSTRRFLTVLVLELNYSGAAVRRLNPEEIQTGFELFWNSFHRFVTDEEGVPLPPQSQEFIAVFGAETPYADHPVSAAKSAAAISIWLREWAFKFSQTGREIPHFSIALHCGETVAMQIPGSENLPWAVVGEAVTFARTLVRVCRTDEVVCSEAFLSSFLEALPGDQKSLEIATGDEPDLDGLNWDVADFIPLEEHLRNRTILVGADVRERPDSASVWFRYLYSISDPESDAVARVLGVFFSGTVPAMANSQELADPDARFRRLGKYRLLKTLGHGGMGSVWLGQDGFGNHAALKTLLDPTSGETSQIARFEREARVMSQLNHRNICRIIEMDEYDGIRFIAMEYVAGVTLADILENVPDESADEADGRKKPVGADLPSLVRDVQDKKLRNLLRRKRQRSDPPAPVMRPGHSLALFLKICDAVEFAHGKGILHRDLKPGNVLIREDGDPVVSDFGLAKLRHANDAADVSQTGQVLGTLAYMAPEQALSSKDVDERADVFSLGAILYRMLVGSDQFRTTGNFAADVQILANHEPARPSKLRDSIPEDLDAITMKALGKEPAARYRSVQALRDDVARFLLGEPIHARPPTTADIAKKLYRRHRVAANSIGGALVFAIILVVVAFASIAGQRNEAVGATGRAERERAKAVAARKEAEANLEKLKAEQILTAKQKNTITALQSSHDIHAVRPEDPFASSLVREGSSADAVARESVAEASRQLEELSKNPKLNTMTVEQEADGTWPPFPREVPDALAVASESASTARILAPASPAALIAAGWCALLDFDPDSARTLFDRARESADTPELRDRCDMLSAAAYFASPTEIPETAVGKLKKTGNPQDRAVAKILSALYNKVVPASSDTSLDLDDYRRILGVRPGARTIAAIFLDRDPQGILDVGIVNVSQGVSCLYLIGSGVTDLRPLRGIFERLKNPGTTWTLNVSHTCAAEIPALPVEKIVASESWVSRVAVTKSFPLKVVDLNGSKISDLGELLMLPSLEVCKLNRCVLLKNPQALFDRQTNRSARTLKVLETAGVAIPSLAGIPNLESLERLRFSPAMVADQASISKLRAMKSLVHIAADGESENQTSAEFWQKHSDLP
jgi:serine/threonine protein kinase/class 3 adenylate cyclase